ncbi:MAG: hypothetical protein M0T79_02215 [Actinomycetota bacterium]|nr:hypothetical protein [Actinomycetota bacterium]
MDYDKTAEFSKHRTRLMRDGLACAGATAGPAAAILALSESAALASTPSDVQILQTAASIENLAVATYGAALKTAGAGTLVSVASVASARRRRARVIV